MDTFIGDVGKPGGHFDIGGAHVKQCALLLEPAHERHVERATQIPVEALHLALGLGPVRSTQFDDESTMVRVVEKPGVEAVLPVTVVIALHHHGLHVVVEHFFNHAAKACKGVLVALDQGVDFHVRHKFHKACPAVAKRCAEGVEWSTPRGAKLNPVDLHLLARGGLKAH